MNTEAAIGDFIEFYLLPAHSSKTIALTQLKLIKQMHRLKNDELMQAVSSLQTILKTLKKLRKHRVSHLHFSTATPEQKAYLHLTHLDPSDCLLLISNDRYALSDEVLSLALKQSEATIDYRRKQLQRQLHEEKLPLPDLKNFDPKNMALSTINHQVNHSMIQTLGKLPIIVRFLIETAAVLGVLFLLMWIIPEMRNRYENTIQKRINDYLIEASLIDSPAPTGTSKGPKTVIPSTDSVQNDTGDAPELISSSSTPPNSKKTPRVVEGETWRFSFTGSMTNEIEAGVTGIFKTLSLEQNKPVTVPGGIQFDLVLPTQSLLNLKNDLEEMTQQIQRKSQSNAGKSSESNAPSGLGAVNMSWYKKRNMGTRKIPSGNVQVIIWISTL